jgi:cyclophilin family peptidyl-prolyl cis-trans isomerase
MLVRRLSVVLALLGAALLMMALAAACGGSGGTEEETASGSEAAASAPTRTAEQRSGKFLTEAQKTDFKQWTEPPAMTIDPNKKYRAIVRTKGAIEFVIELYAKEAPMTVNNFVFLAREGFYDGVIFHRVIGGFVAQTGDSTGTGTGGPGYAFDNEFSPNARHSEPGMVAMANRGLVNGKGTNGSQWYVIYTPQPQLDGLNPDGSPKDCAAPDTSCHTVFGKVVEGMFVIRALSPRQPGDEKEVRPADTIDTITIEEVP